MTLHPPLLTNPLHRKPHRPPPIPRRNRTPHHHPPKRIPLGPAKRIPRVRERRTQRRRRDERATVGVARPRGGPRPPGEVGCARLAEDVGAGGGVVVACSAAGGGREEAAFGLWGRGGGLASADVEDGGDDGADGAAGGVDGRCHGDGGGWGELRVALDVVGWDGGRDGAGDGQAVAHPVHEVSVGGLGFGDDGAVVGGCLFAEHWHWFGAICPAGEELDGPVEPVCQRLSGPLQEGRGGRARIPSVGCGVCRVSKLLRGVVVSGKDGTQTHPPL